MKTTSECSDFGVFLDQAASIVNRKIVPGRMIGGLFDSEDIAQMAAILQWQRVEKSGAAVRFAMLHAFKYGAPARRNASSESGQSADYAASIDGVFESVDIEDMLATLPPDAAGMLRLRYLEGYTLEEIGDVYGMERRVVARVVRQALEKLRGGLDG